ncbi:MAG TPA: hypothetical protein VFZ87_09295 [Gemmatimonadales bacterium]
MTYLFKLAHRTARLRALALIASASALAACDTDRLTNSSGDPAPASAEPFSGAPLFATGFRGGIPFGTWALPTSEFGPVFNGAMRTLDPNHLRSELAEIKSRGGRVILSLAGKETNYLDGDHHFSLSLWKERVDRFKGVDFSSFIEDGTVIGHYIIDEPNDPVNWGGRPVPGSMVEQMAAYSKQLWPGMATIVRAEPKYLAETGGPYRHLDAAWAQYVTRKGTPKDYIERNVADAQQVGLALVTGLNITKGSSTGGEMSAALVESAGSTILANSYPCAFISWEYRDGYMARADIKSAMAVLSNKAEAHASRSCGSSSPTTPPPPPPLPGISGIVLTGTKVTLNGDVVVKLSWKGAAGTMVDFYRNGAYRRTIRNDGSATAYPTRAGTKTYKICEAGKTRCSNTVSVTIN